MTAETLAQSTARSTKNAFTGCFGFLRKTDELAKITFKESQITSRKKAFGVEYMDLLAANAKPEELEACVQRALDDTKELRDQIAELEKEIARVDEETQKKIIARPTTSTDTPAPPEGPAPAPVVEAPAAAPVVEAPAADPVVEAPAAAPVVEAPAAAPAVEAPAPAPAPVDAA